MKTFDAATIARHAAGEVDAIDALTLVFDSATVNLAIGIKGQFTWDDVTLGEQTFYGAGKLVALDVPENAIGPESRAITATLYETYMEEGSDTPVNVFDDGVRATIDEEEWEGRTAIGSIFWLGAGGTIIEREQVFVRQIDAMPVEWDEAGNPMRRAILEEPDIIQRDVEGKTANTESQALIDATDDSFKHVGTARTGKINFGRRAEAKVETGYGSR